MDYRDIISSKYSEPAAVISYRDGALSILEVNESYIPELWMNVSKEDYMKAYPQSCFDEENLQTYLSAVQKCIRTGQEQTAEIWHLVFSNCCGYDKVCMKSRFVLIEKTDDGAVIYEGIRNISNEKRTQNTLEDIEYRYKNASEQINIYNWEYDIATRDMRPCYRCMRDLGLPALVHNYPEPAIDMGIFPPDYADMYRDMMRRVDAGEDHLEADIPLTVGRIPFRVKYTTTFDENGKPIKAFGSATLISDAELGRIKLGNQIIARLAEGYCCIYLADFEKDEINIVKQDDIFSLEEKSRCIELLTHAGSRIKDIPESIKNRLDDITLLTKDFFVEDDNREFIYKDDDTGQWIRIDAHVIDKKGGVVQRLLITVAVFDDYRAQKMNDDRLIAAQKEELLDRQKMLLEAIDVANRANEAKTVFFSNMSHDIRTPMNAITGFSRLAIEEIDDKKQVEDYLGKIAAAGDHLMSLINDILDMSRIESGKMELNLTPVSIRELLSECADIMRIKMEEKQQLFMVDLDATGDDLVDCDKVRFNQVILNLLSNAYKYTPEGGCICLEGRLLDRGDSLKYEIRVRDNGIGMSEEFSKHIWEAYSREETGTVHETQGTGLGMVIVRNIINMMQGAIEVESKPDEGTEFIIVLPLRPSRGDASEPEVDRDREAALNKNYEGVTLLVVDDSAINLMVAEKTLYKFGFKIMPAESGVEAYQLVADSKPGEIDLILMDVMMPVMDGLETTRRIRAISDPKLAAIPIVAMTANAFETDVKKALDAGMDDYIAKPYKPEDIVPVINANLKGK
ncbi:MAG: response regulator [Lachnospiraceae bacterium]|nr:response regulator [Lachnospiraceae bacterium]